MTFQELTYYFEDNMCVSDHLGDYLHEVTHCISFRKCEVEDLDEYGGTTIAHYCFELGIPAPQGFEDDLEAYRELRKHIRTMMKPANQE